MLNKEVYSEAPFFVLQDVLLLFPALLLSPDSVTGFWGCAFRKVWKAVEVTRVMGYVHQNALFTSKRWLRSVWESMKCSTGFWRCTVPLAAYGRAVWEKRGSKTCASFCHPLLGRLAGCHDLVSASPPCLSFKRLKALHEKRSCLIGYGILWIKAFIKWACNLLSFNGNSPFSESVFRFDH